MSDLSIKATRGMLWSLSENLGLYFMQFIFSIVLARLLLPEQFGLIGMLTIFIMVAQSILDSGFGSALIQKKDATQVDSSSVFYFNLVIGLCLIILLWFIAPLIAQFYSQPLLTPLTRLLSINILINAFRLVPNTYISKQINFKALFKINLTSVVFSGSIGVGMAFKGFGVWSLVGQSLSDGFIRMILTWRASGWKPILEFNLNSLKSLFSFGSRLLASGLLDTFFTNLYQLFIGKVYNATDLGFYVRAQSMENVAVQPTGTALSRVLFPALVPIQNDKDRLKQAYRKIMTTAVFLHFPLTIGLIALARPLIIFLMTDRWAPSVPYFQLFCLVGLFWPLHVLNLNITYVLGRSDVFFKLEITKKIITILAILITFHFGIAALIYGQIFTSFFAYILNSYFSGKLIGYSTKQQIHDIYFYLLISILMGGAMYIIGSRFVHELPNIMAQIFTGVVIYSVINYLVKKSVITDVVKLARQVIKTPSVYPS
jgi:teichuronic acid exporter